VQDSTVGIGRNDARQTAASLVAAFALLVLSSYIVLWNESNRNLIVAGTCLGLFVAGVFCSPDRRVALYAAFGFTALRWLIPAMVTRQPRPIFAAIFFFGVPIVLVAVDVSKRRLPPKSA
jgi:hypothetical protein